jgi:hypothetical protein
MPQLQSKDKNDAPPAEQSAFYRYQQQYAAEYSTHAAFAYNNCTMHIFFKRELLQDSEGEYFAKRCEGI